MISYDFCMKQLSLSYYLQYGKVGYDQLKQSSLEISPSQRINERTLAHLRGGKGCHVARFAAQFVDVMKSRKNYSNEQIEAQIIYDELKIKCGIAYNPKTGYYY